jgi:outer membrane protein
MRVRLIVGWVLVLSVVAAIGYAQQPPAARSDSVRLSLTEALDLAVRNNPTYLTTLRAESPAVWARNNATLSLFTPTFSLGGSYYAQAAASGQIFQGYNIGATPSYKQLSGSLRFNYQLSGSTISNAGSAQASLDAAEQDIGSALTQLQVSVRTEYLNLLAARAQVDVARRQVSQAQEVLDLAQAKYTVGQNTMFEVKSAQVGKGTADVNLLQAQQGVELEVLKLYGLLGVPAPEPPEVVPTDTFAVVAPPWTEDSLIGLGLANNPALLAMRSREVAARWNSRSAYSQFLPTLSATASTGRSKINQGSSPTYYQTTPWTLGLSVSLPIYDAAARNSQVAQANYQNESMRQSIRARELQVRSDVASAWVALDVAYRTIAVQKDNQAAADEALALAQERYRVGSGSIVDLLTAQVTAETAGYNYVSAVYNYHKAIATLEQAVGRPLR